jgi:Asp-tRNA(Asn)/Glu-tRNA(Gln) amidotransferase A subunit family amidase
MISSVELVEHYLGRIAIHNQGLNALATRRTSDRTT